MDIIKSPTVFSPIFQSKKSKEIQDKSINELRNFVQDAVQTEIPNEIIFRVKTGDFVSTLIKESQKGGYEFIIVDKSKGKFRGALTRSEVDRFISKSHCPVLTIHHDFPIQKLEKIVVPIDISQTTKKRLFWATFFAKKFNAKVQIVSALNANIKEAKSLAFKSAEKISNMLIKRGLECEMKILKVHQQERHLVMLDHIKEEQPDLVIIRTHQENRFTGKKIGKFVSEIVHGCTIPVFTVGGVSEHPSLEIN